MKKQTQYFSAIKQKKTGFSDRAVTITSIGLICLTIATQPLVSAKETHTTRTNNSSIDTSETLKSSNSEKKEHIYTEPTVKINNVTFNVEVADTPHLRARGLMFRYQIKPDEGMLFIFDEPKKPSFWMKNTFISLDIIWINSLYKIVGIKKNALPFSENTYKPDHFSKYVLEIKGGQSDISGINVGDTVEFLGPIMYR